MEKFGGLDGDGDGDGDGDRDRFDEEDEYQWVDLSIQLTSGATMGTQYQFASYIRDMRRRNASSEYERRTAASSPPPGQSGPNSDAEDSDAAEEYVVGSGRTRNMSAAGGGHNVLPPTPAHELLRMLSEPLHRTAPAGGRSGATAAATATTLNNRRNEEDEAVAEADFLSAAAAGRRSVDGLPIPKVFAPAAAALDLHVSRMLAELHGGEILVEELPPEGSSTAVIIRIPVLTRPMDEVLLRNATDAAGVAAAAGPWNNPWVEMGPAENSPPPPRYPNLNTTTTMTGQGQGAAVGAGDRSTAGRGGPPAQGSYLDTQQNRQAIQPTLA